MRAAARWPSSEARRRDLALSGGECQLQPQYIEDSAPLAGNWQSKHATANYWRPVAASVLGAAEALHRLGHAGRLVDDLREAHDGDGVVHRHGPAIDLFEEVDELLGAPELGVVVLDVARGEVGDLHHLDLVDHRFEDPFARRVLEADRDEHG